MAWMRRRSLHWLVAGLGSPPMRAECAGWASSFFVSVIRVSSIQLILTVGCLYTSSF